MKNLFVTTTLLAFLMVNAIAQDNKIPLIGSKAPSFTAETTSGEIIFPEDFGDNWKILFSHPQDFTPVCTSELLELAWLHDEFEDLGIKVAVISTDDLKMHNLWKAHLEKLDYRDRGPQKVQFPIIDDHEAKVSRQYGMLHEPVSTTRDIRGVFVIDSNNTIRSVNFYPMEVGRNIHEILPDLLEDISESESITEEKSDAKHTVLVVEDNADVRSFIKEVLDDEYSIEEAENGVEAFHLATEEIPELIISDVMMPKMDGIELGKRLKDEVCTSHIPLIILTAKVSENSQVEGFNIGADAYITKPFTAGILKARVANLIESRKKLREKFSRNINLEPSSVIISSVDEKFILKVKQVMEEHMADLSFGVDQFSEEMNMSRIQFHRKLKALTNHTPAELIRTTRIKRAAELLEKGAGTIGEVAFMVGFNYSSYFTKCFQKQYGKNPSEFLAQNAHSENQM